MNRITTRWLALLLTLAVLLACGAPASHAAGTPVSKAPVIQLPAGWPTALIIPKLNVRANIESLTLLNPSDVHAPYKWEDVAWYDLGAKPGALGRSVIFGHLDSYCCPAVFWHLGDLVPGDQFEVQYRSGQTVTFQVVWNHTYLDNALPMSNLYGHAKQRSLALATCTGTFHRDGTGYDHRIVVFSRLVLPDGQLG
jgi:sortase A